MDYIRESSVAMCICSNKIYLQRSYLRRKQTFAFFSSRFNFKIIFPIEKKRKRKICISRSRMFSKVFQTYRVYLFRLISVICTPHICVPNISSFCCYCSKRSVLIGGIVRGSRQRIANLHGKTRATKKNKRKKGRDYLLRRRFVNRRDLKGNQLRRNERHTKDY